MPTPAAHKRERKPPRLPQLAPGEAFIEQVCTETGYSRHSIYAYAFNLPEDERLPSRKEGTRLIFDLEAVKAWAARRGRRAAAGS